MPDVVIIAGPNGAGKSTLAPAVLRGLLSLDHFVNADVIARGLSEFNPESAAFEAGRIMLERIRELAAQRLDFAFETTLASRTFAPWISVLIDSGYRFRLLYVWVRDPELSLARVAERVRSGGHNVPEEDVRRRYSRGLRNFFELYRPLADTWQVYDNSLRAQPTVVAEGRRLDKLVIHNEATWEAICSAAGDAARG